MLCEVDCCYELGVLLCVDVAAGTVHGDCPEQLCRSGGSLRGILEKSTGLMLWESARLMAVVLAANPNVVSRVLSIVAGNSLNVDNSLLGATGLLVIWISVLLSDDGNVRSAGVSWFAAVVGKTGGGQMHLMKKNQKMLYMFGNFGSYSTAGVQANMTL
ncbi:hypothetical protein F0562_015337 [Nyssa sinensis]|uniref:Uncharacterized protein n=1 Tax=Nyssa sinensis TaxID=561372 RepID=A0A5J4ZJ83_9ASTE|nr:hypothetical protein F0562_015337 [Nyssa sinensis]